MANAFRCDRCGNFQEGVPAFAAYVARCKEVRDLTTLPHPGVMYMPDPNVQMKPLELCRDCGHRILRFLNAPIPIEDPAYPGGVNDYGATD